MLLPDHALIFHMKAGTEGRLRKTLPPYLFRKMPRQFQIHFGFIQIAVCFDDTLQISQPEQRLGGLLESIAKFFEIASYVWSVPRRLHGHQISAKGRDSVWKRDPVRLADETLEWISPTPLIRRHRLARMRSQGDGTCL